jgi:hypothetical protein
MKRRELITLLGGGAVAWPLRVGAQQLAMPVVGFLGSATPQGYARFIASVWQGLNESGFTEGRNLAAEYRWANEQYERLPALAASCPDATRSSSPAPLRGGKLRLRGEGGRDSMSLAFVRTLCVGNSDLRSPRGQFCWSWSHRVGTVWGSKGSTGSKP